MASDRSRRTDRSRDGYKGVVAQQGRVILDRDFNTQQALEDARVALDALSFVGPCGAPGDGFKIALGAAFRPLILRSPPSSPVLFDRSFTIAPGVMFVGGQAAILPVHYAGQACDMDAIWRIARVFNLKVVEDAAHASGTYYRDAHVGSATGSKSDAVAFSFYATKNLTTAEGGMVTTSDGDLNERMRRLSLHGSNCQAPLARSLHQSTRRYRAIGLSPQPEIARHSTANVRHARVPHAAPSRL